MARGRQSDMWEHTAAKLCQYHNAHVEKENMMSIDFFHPLRATKSAKVQVDAKVGLNLMAKLFGIEPIENNSQEKVESHGKLVRDNVGSD